MKVRTGALVFRGLLRNNEVRSRCFSGTSSLKVRALLSGLVEAS